MEVEFEISLFRLLRLSRIEIEPAMAKLKAVSVRHSCFPFRKFNRLPLVQPIIFRVSKRRRAILREQFKLVPNRTGLVQIFAWHGREAHDRDDCSSWSQSPIAEKNTKHLWHDDRWKIFTPTGTVALRRRTFARSERITNPHAEEA